MRDNLDSRPEKSKMKKKYINYRFEHFFYFENIFPFWNWLSNSFLPKKLMMIF